MCLIFRGIKKLCRKFLGPTKTYGEYFPTWTAILAELIAARALQPGIIMRNLDYTADDEVNAQEIYLASG